LALHGFRLGLPKSAMPVWLALISWEEMT